MAALTQKIGKALGRRFKGAVTDLEIAGPGSRVSGFVVWKGFQGLDMSERVRDVWEVLQEQLSPAELKRVSLIVPFSPIEMVMRQEERAEEETSIQRAARVASR